MHALSLRLHGVVRTEPAEKGGTRMEDLLYLGITLLFFGLSWGFVLLCEGV